MLNRKGASFSSLHLLLFFLLLHTFSFGASDTTINTIQPHQIKGVDFGKIDKGVEKISNRLKASTAKVLKRMRRKELSLLRKLQKRDSVLAANISLQQVDSIYKQKLNQLGKTTASFSSAGEYFPSLDSLNTGLAFLKKSGNVLSNEKLAQIGNLSADIGKLQQQFKTTADLQTFLTERKSQLKQCLSNALLVKEWKRVNKEIYYYQQQIREYKELLKHPDKMLEKMMGVLRKQPSFSAFMANNSQLAQLFRLPGQSSNTSSATPIAGLQTRAGVSQLLQQQFQTQGMQYPGAFFQQQVRAAQAEMNAWKEKLNRLGGGSADLEMPDFKPNGQKTKSFLQRLEWGVNIQSQRPNGLFPVTSEFALMVGYKLNDKSTIGVGTAYKMGWGKNFNDIRITHQGVGLRSFLDIKLKGSFWITGGYELNYQQEFNRLDQLKDLNAWQRSGLIGLTKKYSIGKKKGNLQLLWDFLSYEQVPRTKALQFRVGYVF